MTDFKSPFPCQKCKKQVRASKKTAKRRGNTCRACFVGPGYKKRPGKHPPNMGNGQSKRHRE